MDIEDVAKSAGLSATIITVIGAIIAIIKKMNNKKFHSSCCGRSMDVIVAVNELTEEEKHPTPKPSPVLTATANKDHPPPLDYII
jgi:hypothetical protein